MRARTSWSGVGTLSGSWSTSDAAGHGSPPGLPLNFLPVNRDGLRGGDADAHAGAVILYYFDHNVVADHDLLAGTAGDDEHERDSSLDSGSGVPSVPVRLRGLRRRLLLEPGEQRSTDRGVRGLVDHLVPGIAHNEDRARKLAQKSSSAAADRTVT